MTFQDFERHCSKTALDEKKCSFAAVALKILKTCLGACRNKRLTMFLRSVRNFSIEDGVYRPDLLKFAGPLAHGVSDLLSAGLFVKLSFDIGRPGSRGSRRRSRRDSSLHVATPLTPKTSILLLFFFRSVFRCHF